MVQLLHCAEEMDIDKSRLGTIRKIFEEYIVHSKSTVFEFQQN